MDIQERRFSKIAAGIGRRKPRLSGACGLLKRQFVLVVAADFFPNWEGFPRLWINASAEFFVEIPFCKANKYIARS